MQPPRLRAYVLGFTLTELMVAMVIGLIGSIVIFQVYANFEGQNRTTTGAGDAQTNGLLALYSIERDARASGFGINYLPLQGCPVVFTDNGPPQRLNQTFTMTGALINSGVGGAPDSITFVYGNSSLLSGSVQLTSAPNAGATSFTVGNPFGINAGDILILGQTPNGTNPGPVPPQWSPSCTLAQATSVLGSVLTVNDTTYRYGLSGGLPYPYTIWSLVTASGGVVFDLGPAPTVGTYSIDPVKFQLLYQNSLTDASPSAAVDGIVQLQAQYGEDTINAIPTTVNSWTTTMPANPQPSDWNKILALRIAIVAQSSQPEKPNPTTGLCTTTTTAPTWTGGSISLAAVPNWQCYRYRVFETVVPLRNQIWAPQ